MCIMWFYVLNKYRFFTNCIHRMSVIRTLVVTRCFYYTSKLNMDELEILQGSFGQALFSISRRVQLPSIRNIDTALSMLGFVTQAIDQLYSCFFLLHNSLVVPSLHVNLYKEISELLSSMIRMWQYAIMQIVNYLLSKKVEYRTMESPQAESSQIENDVAHGIILTMDSDGYNYGVLSSTSQSSSHLLEQIFSELSIVSVRYYI